MNKEFKIQAECVKWLWNTHPETRKLFFAISNNSEHVVRGVRRKALGMVSGVADTEFLWQGKAYFIEFKAPDGKQSYEQGRWGKKISKHGFKYFICDSIEEFKKIISEIMDKK